MSANSVAGAGAAVVLLLLGACAAPQRTALPLTPWSERAAQLQAIGVFTLHGRLAAVSGQQGLSAGVAWHQQGEAAQIDLTAPLGFGAARIEQQGTALTVTTAKGERLTSSAATDELTATLGFEPPLRSLRYWVLGVDDPADASQHSLDTQQRLAALTQDGWQVQVLEYQRVGDQWLPRRLTVTRDMLRLKLVIDVWQL